MRQRLRVPFLLLIVLSLPLLGGGLPAGADLPPPLDALVKEVLPDDPSPVPGAVKISAGTHHTCAVTSTGDAYCWGRNTDGQLGDGTTTNRSTPVKVLPGAGLAPGTIADITAGNDHTCARTTSADAYCWGGNHHGQLGDGTLLDRSTPVRVLAGAGLGSGTVTEITTSAFHTCARTTSGDPYCWGYNYYGGLGDGTTTNRVTPVKVLAGAGLTFGITASIATGSFHTCARTIGGDAYCWGYNSYGQLGDGTTTHRTTPVKTLAGAGLAAGTVASISAGGYHTCATSTPGDAYCWGNNEWGRLGDGTTTQRTAPVKVSAGAGLTSGTVADIAVGDFHTCARTSTSDAYCWGYGYYGQLGNGNTAAQSTTPTKVITGDGLASGTVVGLTAGNVHTCASTTTGDAYCWGDNAYGQLGDGTTTSSAAPTEVVPMIVTPHHCDDASTRVDKVEWSNGANHFSVDIHEKDDGVYTCVYAERNGEVLLDEVVRVNGEVITVDEDADPGNGPDSPCTVDHGEGGTSTNRAYVRSTPEDAYPATVCAGFISTAGNRHVRIQIG